MGMQVSTVIQVVAVPIFWVLVLTVFTCAFAYLLSLDLCLLSHSFGQGPMPQIIVKGASQAYCTRVALWWLRLPLWVPSGTWRAHPFGLGCWPPSLPASLSQFCFLFASQHSP
jgi:hypothetical protein